MTDLTEFPLVSPEGLTAAALDGQECVSCGKRFPMPGRIVGRTAAGQLVRKCDECEPPLEAVQ
jgi:hypothetical protein